MKRFIFFAENCDSDTSMNFRSIGDDRTADMLDGINVDEIQHVRFANRWIKKLGL